MINQVPWAASPSLNYYWQFVDMPLMCLHCCRTSSTSMSASSIHQTYHDKASTFESKSYIMEIKSSPLKEESGQSYKYLRTTKLRSQTHAIHITARTFLGLCQAWTKVQINLYKNDRSTISCQCITRGNPSQYRSRKVQQNESSKAYRHSKVKGVDHV